MKHIYFTVTNDLTYDQRMHRICNSLAENGFKVTLVGRKLKSSRALHPASFEQKRIKCLFNKGFLFYGEYNLRLYLYLLNQKMDALCAIDLDTILPCLMVSKWKKITRIYDAHEYFTELKEVRARPLIKWFWNAIERYSVPQFRYGYTVSEGLALEFKKQYNRDYTVIRNLPFLKPLEHLPASEKFLFYGGAVNEGRGFEYLIPAMKEIPYKLVIAGDGNFMSKLRQLIKEYELEKSIELTGMLPPTELRSFAEKATLGIALAEKEGLNQYYALPNKFLEYIHACLPQVTMNYPEYTRLNEKHKVAILINELSIPEVIKAVNGIMKDETLQQEIRNNCLQAREEFNWQQEEKKLISFYKSIFSSE